MMLRIKNVARQQTKSRHRALPASHSLASLSITKSK